MLLRTSTVAVGAAIAGAAALIAVASPAAAADSYTTDCRSPLKVSGNVGDEVTITMTGDCTYIRNLNGTYVSSEPTYTQSGFLDFVSASPTPGMYYFASHYFFASDWYLFQSQTPPQSFTATIRGTDGGGAALRDGATMSILIGSGDFEAAVVYVANGTDAAVPIPDVIQQVGAPSGGSCDTITDESLNWAGVSSGGWRASWAEWANGGAGGAVCTRTLHFDNGWSVAS